jgi:large subunit ribosomal protein L36
MKIRASVRKICEKCRLIRRRGRIIVIVPTRGINKDKDNLTKGTKVKEKRFWKLLSPFSPSLLLLPLQNLISFLNALLP